jgi:hypothetical protein
MDGRNAQVAGVGAIAFGVLTFVSITLGDWPGGNYDADTVRTYVTPSHLPIPLTATLLGLIGLAGLICLLAYLRQLAEAARPFSSLWPQIIWAVGLAGGGAFAVGWGLVSAQPLAHAEAGVDLAVSTTLTYMISEATSALIFGPGPMLVGIALVMLSLGVGQALPAWLRWSTLVAGLAAIASLAFFPFFLFLLWSVVIGVWLLVSSRRINAGSRVTNA